MFPVLVCVVLVWVGMFLFYFVSVSVGAILRICFYPLDNTFKICYLLFMLKLNEVYLGDCLDIMQEIDDQTIDLILCDLPYGVTRNKLDIVIPFDKLWKQYKRIIKDHGAILLFAQGLFYIDLINSNRKMYRYDLVWDKCLTTGFLNANRMPLRQHEMIVVFYKKLPTYNPQMKSGKPLHGRGKAYLHNKVINNNYGKFSMLEDIRKGATDKFPTSVLSFPKDHPSQCVHPTQKPTILLKYLIQTYSNPGDVVLDTCAGSGNTGIACGNLNRNFILIEKNEKYYDLILKRLSDLLLLS